MNDPRNGESTGTTSPGSPEEPGMTGESSIPPEDHPGDSPDATDGAGHEPPDQPAAPRAPRWPGLIALLALAVASGAAWLTWDQLQRDEPAPEVGPGELAALEERLGMLEADRVAPADIDALDERIATLTTARDTLEETFRDLRREVRAESRDFDELFARLDSLEARVRARSEERTRASLLQAEAGHYLRLANVQLDLSGDPRLALAALQLADGALRELDDPRLRPVRRQLAGELGALQAVPRPDTEGIVLTLGSLTAALADLPAPEHPGALRARDSDAEDSIAERARRTFGEVLGRLVEVRRDDDPVSPLPDPGRLGLIVQALDLELQLARIAILRGDAALFRRTLDAARQRLEAHFDPGAPEVRGMLDTLREMSAIEMPEALPDISGSLNLFLEITAGDAEPAA